ncbi:hypothetical protein [Streptomyces sp. NRRL WC-3742]|uniref:hypothetical protein n=1 Tax=Streptomyces sp. NRRL WC-3742 TaxID=1463934 RepID=UPI0004C580B2|nr:hypothetical protein [Streptomyces sp. NRRL WC-3742]
MSEQSFDNEVDNEIDEVDDEDDSPWIIDLCPVSTELAAQIVAMMDLDLDDADAVERAMAEAGWRSTGEYHGDYNESAYTPGDHLVDTDVGIALPFAHQYFLDPDEEPDETYDIWAQLPGWQRLIDPPAGTFEAELEAVVDRFTRLIGPPDHDLVRDFHPRSCRRWPYRVWRRGGNVLTVALGMSNHSYSQFEQLYVQIRPLPADRPLPPVAELPDFFFH